MRHNALEATQDRHMSKAVSSNLSGWLGAVSYLRKHVFTSIYRDLIAVDTFDGIMEKLCVCY